MKLTDKFKLLDDYNISHLFDDWCFKSLVDFADDVESGGIIDYDGYGEFIYIDKKGTLYTKLDEYIYPSEIGKIISEEASKEDIFFTCFDAAKAIREKYTDGEYKPFAVFWYNR